MKKIIIVLISIIILLASCSSAEIVVINGLNSNIKELNEKYNNKAEDDYFITLYVYSNDNGIVTYIEDTNETLLEVDLVFKDDSLAITSRTSSAYEIKTKNSIINPNMLEKKDVLICYTKDILEVHPGQIIVSELYYLNIKTDKDFSNAILANHA